MKEEIEIKAVLKNPKEVERKLRKISRFIGEKKQVDEYFVPRHKDFFAKDQVVEYLRVRHEKGKNNVGYHFCHMGRKGELLKTDEYETEVKDPKMMSLILKKLDMANRVTVAKQRKYFEYKNFEIVLDNVRALGNFIEIEAKKPAGSVEMTKKKCYGLLEELGADWEKAPNKGYPDMIIEKK